VGKFCNNLTMSSVGRRSRRLISIPESKRLLPRTILVGKCSTVTVSEAGLIDLISLPVLKSPKIETAMKKLIPKTCLIANLKA